MPKRILIFAVVLSICIVFLLGTIVGMLFSQKPQTTSLAASPEASASAQVLNAAFEIAIVTRVIDGDTIELAGGRKLRYIGMDTPETVDPRRPVGCFGREASEKNKAIVLGKTVELEKDVSETDRNGRLLRYVYIQIDGQRQMVNELLVKEGYAHSSSYPPDIKYQAQLDRAETEAREQNRGLWGSCGLPSSSDEVLGVVESAAQPSPNTPASSAAGCTIKGNISTNGEKIYHMSGCGSYEKTVIDEKNGERMFCSEKEAVDSGWRKAGNC